ncbi:MAG: hypothetical protein U0Q22_18140 [Acidimicrobiales bacterium]
MKSSTKVVLGIAAALVVLVLAVAVVAGHDQLSSPPTTSGPAPTLPGGKAAMEVIRPFAPEVAWNRPVAEFGRSSTYEPYVERFWKYSSYGGWNDPKQRGVVYVQFRDYSTPIYDARLATGHKRAFFANFGFPPSPGFSVVVPWNDSWKAANGNDAMMLMVDPDTGEHWSLWDYQGANPSTCLTFDNLAKGYSPFNDLCVGGVIKLLNEDGSTGDYRTWNSTQVERGMGIPKLALITTPYEVRAGAIRHALEMTIFGTMFGPPCTADQIGTSAAGSSCGFYLPPATRVEWQNNPTNNCGANNQPNTDATRRTTVPEGMRFALDISDADIEAWLDQRGYTGPLRSTARIFAVALRDYGWIIAETGCFGDGIEVDGMINPAAKEIWTGLGIADTPEAGNFLDGLFTKDRIYVVNPPAPVASSKPPQAGRAG